MPRSRLAHGCGPEGEVPGLLGMALLPWAPPPVPLAPPFDGAPLGCAALTGADAHALMSAVIDMNAATAAAVAAARPAAPKDVLIRDPSRCRWTADGSYDVAWTRKVVPNCH